MTDNNKQSIEYIGIRKWCLIGAAIVFTILIFYFTLTDTPISTSDVLNKISLNKNTTNISYKWWNLLLILVGIILLPLFYLTTTKKLNKVYNKLIRIYKSFKSIIQLPEKIKDLAIFLVVSVVLFSLSIGLSFNCCGWWNTLFTRLSSPIEPINLRNVLIGIAGVVTLVFAGWRTYIADQNRILEKRKQLNARFDNVVAILSKELNDISFVAHLEAISGLRALAIDSPEDSQRCLDIICSCNQWMEGYIDELIGRKNEGPYSSWSLKKDNRIAKKDSQYKVDGITLLQEKRSQEVLRAISHILTDISTNNPGQLQTLKFHNKKLCGISLSNIKLDGIDFHNTYLVAASLDRISLKQTTLDRAHLQGASLEGAHLEGATLRDAHLEGASLYNAHLEGTSLWGAHLEGAILENTHLDGAYLEDTHLEGAYLEGAHLEGAYLGGAHLEGAYLYNANLARAFLAGTSLQGSSLDYVDLSYALLLDCNLYGATLRDIRGENIVFNDIMDIGNIKDKKERKKYINNMHHDIKPQYLKLFAQRMETAWQAMENNQEPDGLEVIRANSIITKDSQGMYDISDKHLTNLEERWQKLVDDKDVNLLRNMRTSLLLLENKLCGYKYLMPEDASIYKNANLVKKLQVLIEKLIASNKPQNNK